MGLFDRLKPALPEVPVGPEVEDLVHARVREMTASVDPEGAVVPLRALIEEDLFAHAAEFRAGLGVPDLELASELMLHGLCGAQLALEAEVERPQATALLQPYQDALAQYVAWKHRERFEQGPVPVLNAAEKINRGANSDRDVRHVVLGLLALRLGVAFRKGASEGLIRLALLSQMGGFGLGTLIWKRQ